MWEGKEQPRENPIFRRVWNFNNPNYSKYQQLAQVPTRWTNRTEYSSQWQYFNSTFPDDYKNLSQIIGNSPLVDFGCGSRKLFKFLDPEKKLQKPLQINIDEYPFGQVIPLKTPEPTILEETDTEILIQGDNLLAAAQIQTESVNCSINGIEWGMKANADYEESLAEELVRITKKGGVIFGMGSHILDDFCRHSKFLENLSCSDNTGSDFYIFRKK
jgi:hypothetical protein